MEVIKLYNRNIMRSPSFLYNVFDDIDTCILHISAYSNEIRVSVTCLITITLINNRKIDIQ